ncbi:MAG: cytochrome o ubiquinol oxidase subunit III [Proteobacteria bacterium]|nr:cytochrome o ubiquinol oxidase subunit III [Pseudomonadota bacterium]
MSLVDALTEPTERSRDDTPISERGPAPVHIVVAFGFWLFLLSDIVLFSALFAAYAVLSGQTAGGPIGPQLFDRTNVLIETGCLLLSSFTCGLCTLSIEARNRLATYISAAVTFALGVAFLAFELTEFGRMVAQGAGPTRSAFLSAFFTLVGTHGLHVAFGLGWLIVMMAQVATLGFRPMVVRRLLCFCLFWHALDIVWIGVFTIVYLGAH